MPLKHNSPGIAIVIPVRNEAAMLPQALQRLKALQGVDEIVFVDGESSDGSAALIQAAGFICLLSTAGRAKQMNMGTAQTKSEIILYLHVDTAISSSHISDIKKTYNQAFAYGRFDVSLSNKRLTYRIISFFINLRSCLSKVATGDQGIFVRRTMFEAVGGYPEIPLMEDIALTKALRRKGKVLCLRNKLETSSRRWEQHGVMRTVWLMWKLRFLYWLGVSPEKLAGMYRDAR